MLIDLYPSKPALIDNDPDENARDMGAFLADGFTPDTKQGVFQPSIQMLNNPPLRVLPPSFCRISEGSGQQHGLHSIFGACDLRLRRASPTGSPIRPINLRWSGRRQLPRLGSRARSFTNKSAWRIFSEGELMVSGGEEGRRSR